MSGFEVDPPVIGRAGARVSRHADQLAESVGAFTAGAAIPSSAVGPIGPGQDALKAYEDLLSHVTQHLNSVREAVAKTGARLTTSATNYEKMEQANTIPGC